MSASGGFAFGPYRLELRAKRLLRDGKALDLPVRQLDLLAALAGRVGETVNKDDLVNAIWPGQPISDNSLVQAVSQLRAVLDARHADRFIVTVKGRGYKFVAPVTRIDPTPIVADLEALLVPHRAWLDGRAALETLERASIAHARATFDALVASHGDDARFHVGLANACALLFESTRADLAPDTEALQLAVMHARLACQLDPDNGEAWATLGFVLERIGARADALGALRHATTIEPDNWRHLLRLAFGSGGEERLRAARRTLAHLRECPLARWLAATVYVARGALALAEREIDAGLAAMPPDGGASSRFSAVALHWLKGLLCLARGADEEAMRAFACELALEPLGHLYARECCANTWYAIGVTHLRRGDTAAARNAFDQAIARVPRHPMAHVALRLLAADAHRNAADAGEPASVDAAVSRAAWLVNMGDASAAARLVAATLASAPAGNAGWTIPIEPLLNVQRAPEVWTSVLGTLRTRAS
jgi:DNA-binding winged helix-turn-helix (wHTH) protein